MNSNQDVLINFVLDCSGSMMPVTDATCEGFNQFKMDQLKNPGETLMTLTLFDTKFDTRYVGVPLHTVPDLGSVYNNYYPSGCTALFDAVGESIKKTEHLIKDRNWTDRVMVVILTDGQENSSQKWHIINPRRDNDQWDVAGLIEWKQKEGWDFIFLGAGGTEWLERTFHTLPADTFFSYDNNAGATRAAYATVNSAMTKSRTTGQTLRSAMVDSTNTE